MKNLLTFLKIIALIFTIPLFLMFLFVLVFLFAEANSTMIVLPILFGLVSYVLIRSVNRDWASDAVLEKRKRYEELEITKNINNVVFVDEDKEKWFVAEGGVKRFSLNPNKHLPTVYNFSDADEIYTVNGDRITLSAGTSKKSGGISRAIVGGMLAGGAGALVGAHTAKTRHTSSSVESQAVFVSILLKDKEEPIRITCNTEVLADSLYRSLVFTFGLTERDTMPENTNQQTTTSQLREYKVLFDEGVLTSEEFEVKKKQLLELQ